MVSFDKIQRSILVSLGLGLAVAVAIGVLADVRAVGQGLSTFRWVEVPLILGLTLLNYALRWAKWDYYLRRLGQGTGVSYGDSMLLFTSGLIMSVTPGKVGEVFKSYLLRRLNGTPVSASAPIVVAERLTDGAAMLLLMALGLTLYPPAWLGFVLLVALTIAGVLVAQRRTLCERIVGRVAQLPMGAKIAPKLLTLYVSMHQLIAWRVLLVSTLLSFVSWGSECLAFFLVLVGLGFEPSVLLLQQATFIFAASTLLGIVSLLPGGLGASEVSSAGLLVLLVPMGASDAAVATLIIRFCTLWFGVALGIGALLWFGRRYGLRRHEPVYQD